MTEHERFFRTANRLDEKVDDTNKKIDAFKDATDERMDGLNSKVDGVKDSVHSFQQSVTREMGHVSGKLDILAAALADKRQIDVAAATASIEVGTKEKLDAIETRKFHREKALKLGGLVAAILSGITALVAALSGALHC